VVKRIAILVTLFACVGLSFFISVPTRTASAQTGQIELACPAGSSPMPIIGQTFNISTGKFRQWLCVDTNGNITQSTGVGGTTPPGGANTNVQFNNAGAFGGTSSFTYDGATTVSIGNGSAGALVVNSSSTTSSTGAIRLPISQGLLKTGIGWRNNANNADLILVPNTSDQLTFNNNVISTVPVTSVNLTAQQANIAATTLVTPSANGFFRFSCYIVETQEATTSSTLPRCDVIYTDADTSTSITGEVNGLNTTNVVGATGLNQPPLGPLTNFYAKSGVAIQYATNGYASSGSPAMQYAIHIRLEGPF
jgi:hypothetical protein